jgi:protein-tyrosine phosphatase
MKHLVEQAGLAERFEIESAGTGAYHVGEPADLRSAEAARKKGIELTSEARQFVADDYDTFDYVVAMDRKNHAHLLRLARRAAERDKLFLLRKFEPNADAMDVPDPYFEDNFDDVFEICRAGCAGLLEHILRERGLSR